MRKPLRHHKRCPAPVVASCALLVGLLLWHLGPITDEALISTMLALLPYPEPVPELGVGIAAVVRALMAAKALMILPVFVLSIGAVVLVIRRLLAGVDPVRPLAPAAFLVAAATDGPGISWSWAAHVLGAIAVAGLLYAAPGARRFFAQGPRAPRFPLKAYRWSGILLGLFLVRVTAEPRLSRPLAAWLARPDGPSVTRSSLIATEALMNDGLLEEMLAMTNDAQRTGSLPTDLRQRIDVIVEHALPQQIPNMYAESLHGTVTRLGIIVAIGVVGLTVLPAVIDFSKGWAAGSVPVRPLNRARLPGQVLRWNLAENGWQGLHAYRWLRHRILALGPADPDQADILPRWRPHDTLRPRYPLPVPIALRDLLNGLGTGIVLGLGLLLVVQAARVTAQIFIWDWLLLNPDALIDSYSSAVPLDPLTTSQMRLDMIRAGAEIQRSMVTLMVALLGLWAAVVVAVVAIQGRREVIANDVTMRWRLAGQEWLYTELCMVDRVGIGPRGWIGRVRRRPHGPVLGWFPLVDLTRSSLAPPTGCPIRRDLTVIQEARAALYAQRLRRVAVIGVLANIAIAGSLDNPQRPEAGVFLILPALALTWLAALPHAAVRLWWPALGAHRAVQGDATSPSGQGPEGDRAVPQ